MIPSTGKNIIVSLLLSLIHILRLGKFDVLVGINLLREGLDLPEVEMVAIMDADKEGFLRSETSLIQTIGRAARNVDGKVIMYADTVTDSMRKAIDETNRRRAIQMAYNEEHHITCLLYTSAFCGTAPALFCIIARRSPRGRYAHFRNLLTLGKAPADLPEKNRGKRPDVYKRQALRLISIGFVVSSISVISSGALEGLGMGGPSLAISLLRYVALILPLAFVLSRFFGASGVWHAFWVTEFLTAGVSYALYRRGTARRPAAQ